MSIQNPNTRDAFIGCVIQLDGSIDIIVPPAAVKEFKQMVCRAINTWPDQSDEMRDFADRLFERSDIVGMNMKGSLVQNGEIVQPVVKKKETPVCNGHPETCNCPKHNR